MEENFNFRKEFLSLNYKVKFALMKFVCIETKNFRTEQIWESGFSLPLLLHQNIFFSWNLPNPLKDWKCFIRNFHQNKLNANTELNQLKFTFTISKAKTFCKQDFTRFFALRTQILFPDLVETTNPYLGGQTHLTESHNSGDGAEMMWVL